MAVINVCTSQISDIDTENSSFQAMDCYGLTGPQAAQLKLVQLSLKIDLRGAPTNL